MNISINLWRFARRYRKWLHSVHVHIKYLLNLLCRSTEFKVGKCISLNFDKLCAFRKHVNSFNWWRNPNKRHSFSTIKYFILHPSPGTWCHVLDFMGGTNGSKRKIPRHYLFFFSFISEKFKKKYIYMLKVFIDIYNWKCFVFFVFPVLVLLSVFLLSGCICRNNCYVKCLK